MPWAGLGSLVSRHVVREQLQAGLHPNGAGCGVFKTTRGPRFELDFVVERGSESETIGALKDVAPQCRVAAAVGAAPERLSSQTLKSMYISCACIITGGRGTRLKIDERIVIQIPMYF